MGATCRHPRTEPTLWSGRSSQRKRCERCRVKARACARLRRRSIRVELPRHEAVNGTRRAFIGWSCGLMSGPIKGASWRWVVPNRKARLLHRRREPARRPYGGAPRGRRWPYDGAPRGRRRWRPRARGGAITAIHGDLAPRCRLHTLEQGVPVVPRTIVLRFRTRMRHVVAGNLIGDGGWR